MPTNSNRFTYHLASLISLNVAEGDDFCWRRLRTKWFAPVNYAMPLTVFVPNLRVGTDMGSASWRPTCRANAAETTHSCPLSKKTISCPMSSPRNVTTTESHTNVSKNLVLPYVYARRNPSLTSYPVPFAFGK